MPKLNQIIALTAGKKSLAHKAITEAYQTLQKGGLLDGISRTYRPRDEEGEQYPPEKKLVQLKAWDAIRGATAALTELFDIVATQDFANCQARADVVVGGTTVLKDVPVTHLLFLEKQLVDLHTFVEKLPTLAAREKNEMLERVRRLQEAVKSAREEANSAAVEPRKTGKPVLDYVFGKK
jgi:hypothetical protein